MIISFKILLKLHSLNLFTFLREFKIQIFNLKEFINLFPIITLRNGLLHFLYRIYIIEQIVGLL